MIDKFTYRYYEKLLISFAKNDYDFIFFDEAVKNRSKKYVILRHDIDFDLDKALYIAEIEKKLNIHSTYFFLISSEFYNIHNIYNTKKIYDILEMGNKIGIHFDINNYPDSNNKQLMQHLSKEIFYFENLFGIDIDIVSFHRPDENILLEKIEFDIEHTYMQKYSKKIKYLSDSKKCMPEGDLIKIVSSNLYPKMQLLIHPIWWNHRYTSPQDDYNNYIEKKNNNVKNEILENSKIYRKV